MHNEISTLTIETHLKTLDLSSNANWNDIQSSYRELLKVWHPDKFTHDLKLKKRAEHKTKGIINAFHALKPYFKSTKILDRSFGSLERIITVHKKEVKAPPKNRQPKNRHVLTTKVNIKRLETVNTISMLRKKQSKETTFAKYMGFVAACSFFGIVSAIGFPNTELIQSTPKQIWQINEENLSNEELDLIKINLEEKGLILKKKQLVNESKKLKLYPK